jgi:hypothetical protein
MSHLTRRAGARCLLSFAIAANLIALAAPRSGAQETPNPDERNKFSAFRAGAPVTPEAKAACEKTARWFAARLTDQKVRDAVDTQGESTVVNDLSRHLGLPPHNMPRANLDYVRHTERNADRRPFVDEFGKALVAALQGPVSQNSNYIVRINAARMIAELGRAGYDGAAETCIAILAKPEESDAVKLYALQGLKNLFFIVADLDVPEKTVFQKDNTGTLPALEQRSIKALIDYIFRQPADLKPEQVDGILYVRREAVRALALVRVQRVKDKGNVVCSPALALLKVARGDGLNPPSATSNGPDLRALGERIEAIIGFCNLYQPRSERDMNIDYAAYHIGRAIQELTPFYKFNSRDTSMPWKTQVLWLREALSKWKTMAAEMSLQDAKLISELYDIVDRDILKPIEEGKEDSQPSPADLDQWLKKNPPKSTSLFKNEPKSTIGVP